MVTMANDGYIDDEETVTSKDRLCLKEDEEDITEQGRFKSRLSGPRNANPEDQSGISRLFNVIRRSVRFRSHRSLYRRKSTNHALANGEKDGLQIAENQEKLVSYIKNLVRMKDNAKLKKLVRKNNWPNEHYIRRFLWPLLCDYRDYDCNKQFYASQLNELIKNGGVKYHHLQFIPGDPQALLARYGLIETSLIDLQNLFVIIEYVRPEIRYTTVLFPLGAIFLVFVDSADIFACMNYMFVQGDKFLLQSEVAIFASYHTLLWLVKNHKRKVFKALKTAIGTSDKGDIVELLQNFYDWIFKLPFGHLVRVVDCFVVDGQKMLLRIAISILSLWHKYCDTKNYLLSDSNDRETIVKNRVLEINSQICNFVANCPISSESLLRLAFSFRNFSSATINNRQKHYEEKYRLEVFRRRAEKCAKNCNDSRTETPKRIFTGAFDSSIVSNDLGRELMHAVPERHQLEIPRLLFRLSEHGTSFVQFWERVDKADQSLLIVRTIKGAIFGAYMSNSWRERKDFRERSKSKYFGTAESYVFKLVDDSPLVYRWVTKLANSSNSACGSAQAHNEAPQMFMAAGDRFLVIGSGGGDAISIYDEFTRGSTFPSETFNSPELVPGNEFVIDELEVFEITPCQERN